MPSDNIAAALANVRQQREKQEKKWICENPDCRAEYAEYVNGCIHCYGEFLVPRPAPLHFSVRQHTDKQLALLEALLELQIASGACRGVSSLDERYHNVTTRRCNGEAAVERALAAYVKEPT